MVSCEEFDGFLPLQQSAVYAAAARACGARVRQVDLGIGFALTVERGPVQLVSRGPVWSEAPDAAARRTALRRLARRLGVTLVTPETAVAGFGLIPLVTPMHHAIWDLSGDLRPRLAGNWRGHLAAAERAGIKAIRGDKDALAQLMSSEAAQRAKRRYQALPLGFAEGLPKRSLRLWQWRKAGQLQAAMAFIRHGESATYHLAWGSEVARAAGVHRAMLWQAAQALRTEGVRWLDLGSVDSDRAPGLAQFKLGTGAALRRLGPTLLVLPSCG